MRTLYWVELVVTDIPQPVRATALLVGFEAEQ